MEDGTTDSGARVELQKSGSAALPHEWKRDSSLPCEGSEQHAAPCTLLKPPDPIIEDLGGAGGAVSSERRT